MKKLIILVGFVFLTSCGSSGGGGGKDLFSLWKAEGTNTPLDLTGGSFGAPGVLGAILSGGETCFCSALLIGDQSSGSWGLSDCGSGSCSALNSSGTYTHSGDSATFCDSSGCTVYH